MSAPPSSRWVAKLCRRVWGVTPSTPASSAARFTIAQADWRLRRPPRWLSRTAPARSVPVLRAAKAGRARVSQASSAARAWDPTGTSRSFDPFP